ncbi:hypothetical protein SAMN05444266_11646 [Chitinophaga jiangningensis]|uniref:Uncharacterized protein n=1 Tax=Chitinophaga jiangningensis TaxID=1419482 RepID=A0A1M7N3F8_9BACT|nr:hypothetical protein [Chitinophaga jiangningensis]SHM98071.1 hypothetical protein SAMN05444266_11646 [Chitinophaga jiangningensis]
MNEEKDKNSFGILKSLKKLIFEDDPNAVPPPSPAPQPVAPQQKAPVTSAAVPPPLPATPPPLPGQQPVSEVKQMKLKVLEMLEKLNEPGVDFFEVWNAAAEMGGVDGNNLKAAYTSLKYVDKSLDKQKLLQSGQHYAAELKNIIDRETAQKQQQKQAVEQEQVREKANLGNEIQELERKLNELRQQLEIKQKSLREINSKYEPQLRDIDAKIALGNTAVAEVVNDIQQALQLIESNLI